jgi:hypothetical protein
MHSSERRWRSATPTVFSSDKEKPQQILTDLRGFFRSMAEKMQAAVCQIRAVLCKNKTMAAKMVNLTA